MYTENSAYHQNELHGLGFLKDILKVGKGIIKGTVKAGKAIFKGGQQVGTMQTQLALQNQQAALAASNAQALAMRQLLASQFSQPQYQQQQQQQSSQDWVLPVAIGGAVLVAIMAMQGKKK
jgi:hypothetical protein